MESLMECKVIRFLDLMGEIRQQNPELSIALSKEEDDLMDRKCHGNDSGFLFVVNQYDEENPIINKYLLDNGLSHDDRVIMYVSW